MRILIHCNGGPDIGVGHVSRSLALAEAAMASGHEVIIAGDLHGPLIGRWLEVAGADVQLVGRSAPRELVALARAADPDVIHHDVYEELPADFPVGPLVSNIEDGAFGRRQADLVIDPTLGSEREPRMGGGARAQLRGARYAPLRSVVTSKRGAWRLRASATSVLIVMGGADPLGLTAKALRMLAETRLSLRVTAVSQPSAIATLRSLDLGHLRIDLVEPVEDLPELMTSHDLVVSAAGTSVWELCCLGVPMALVCAVENQRIGYDNMVAAEAALGLGSTLQGGQIGLGAARLRGLLEDPSSRQNLATRAGLMVDGLGAWRIVRAWEQLASSPVPQEPVGKTLAVRRASGADAEMLLRWRNDPKTRAGSRERGSVSLDQHMQWMEASLRSRDRLLLVGADAEGDVGTIRWDRHTDHEWEVSITVDPERRGRSLAWPLLLAGERFLRGQVPDALFVRAVVHEANQPSRRLFERSGYLLDQPADEGGLLSYRKVLPA